MRAIIALFILISLNSCIKEYEVPPTEILPEDKLVQIIADLHTEDAKITFKTKLQPDSVAALTKLAEARVVKKYKTNLLTYRKSRRWYEEHVHNYNRMYEKVVDTLAMREQMKRLY